MLIIYGRYGFVPKVVGYKNDYCLFCKAEGLSVHVRTIDVLHIFWVPLLPIGMWKRWQCRKCSRDPHVSPTTRRSYKIAGAFLLAFITLAFWSVPIKGDMEPATIWAFRIGAPVALGFTIWSITKHKAEPGLAARLRALRPLGTAVCALCGAPLVRGNEWRCSRCLAVQV